MEQGLIFDIKRFALNDGPGIRVTLFIKGCPLHCVWCHNPEGISPMRQRMYKRSKCIGCQSCVDICPNNVLQLTPDRGIVAAKPDDCARCGLCADECPSLAMEMCGKHRTVEELVRLVEKDREVIDQSCGGMTLCGGEPLMHHAYAVEILKAMGQQGLHRCLDTTLFAPTEVVDEVMPHVDLFLVDLKMMDSAKHQHFTGVPNELILKNIYHISEAGADFWIRIPLIVGVNDDDDNLERSARFMASLPKKPLRVELLPYHDVGKGKHERLGTTYNPDGIPMSAPTDDQLTYARLLISAHGLTVV